MIVEVDGVAVHASTGGVKPDPDPNRQTIVLVHGAGMHSTVWQLQTRYLAHRGFQVLAVDLPAHGRSAGTALGSIEDLAGWLGRFLDAAGVERASLVGHSMGAFVAMEAAAALGDRAASLVLLGAASAMPVHPKLLADAESNLPAAAALMSAWSHGKLAHIGPNPTPGMWMTGGSIALVEASSPGVLATDFAACAAYKGAESAAGNVGCHTTVLIGLADRMTPPKAGRGLAQMFANSTIVELAGVGHSMMTEAPRQVRTAILESANSALNAVSG